VEENTPTSTGMQNLNAASTRAEYVPNKTLGVTFDSVDGLTIENCFRNITDKIGGSNIKTNHD
jgi:hypothetical protein